MRAQADAVLVGAGTARADDPRLDVRGLGLAAASPVRVVLAGTLDLPATGRLAASAAEAPLWLCHHAGADAARRRFWAERGATLIEIPAPAPGRLDLGAVLQELGRRGLTRVLCEGGGQLAGALLDAGLVDEVVAYAAGVMLGGAGVPAVGALAPAPLAAAPRFRLAAVDRVGPDVRSRWVRE